jgi:hypothetical protein
MANAPRDENHVTAALFEIDGQTGSVMPGQIDQATGRILTSMSGGGSGTVQTVAVATANGFAGTSDADPADPVLTLTTSVTGILKGNGTAISAITVGSGLAYDGTTLSATGTGSPGGSNTQLQYNNAGAFGGISGVTTNGTTVTATSNNLVVANLLASANDSGALGASGTAFSDLFLAPGGVVNWNNGDVTLTHSTNALFFEGASNGYRFDGPVRPVNDDGNSLGIAGAAFSDLFLANGGVINWNNGNTTLTHSAGLLTLSSTLAVGSGAANGTIQSNGNFDLVLQTGNATTGSITLTDGANGNITASPNGAGQFIVSGTTTGNTAELVNANAGAVGAYLSCYHNSASPSTSDSSGIEFSANNTSAAKIKQSAISSGWVDTTAGSEDGYLLFQPTIAGAAYTNGAYLTGTMLGPLTTNGLALGSINNQWADIFLAEGGVINWDNGDVTLTQTGNLLSVAGGEFEVTRDGLPASFISTTDSASVQAARFEGDRATVSATDEVYVSLYLSDSVGNQDEFVRLTARATDTTSTSEDSQFRIGVLTNGTLANAVIVTGTSFIPSTSDGITLGTTSAQFSDLYLAEGGVINWDNGDATLTQSGNDVTLAGASLTARVKPRTGTTTSAAQPTINTDNIDFYSITAQTEAITSFTTNLSGTPTDGQKLWIAITGTAARSITWGASFEASTVALPTTTVTTNRLDVGFVWNAVTSKWRVVAAA